MTTTTVPIEIACPDWCTVSAAQHVEDLWNMGGVCIHSAGEVFVRDESRGPGVGPLDDPRPAPAFDLHWTAETNPAGGETSPPMFWLNGHEVAIEQALALADAIKAAVRTYRSSGGMA